MSACFENRSDVFKTTIAKQTKELPMQKFQTSSVLELMMLTFLISNLSSRNCSLSLGMVSVQMQCPP